MVEGTSIPVYAIGGLTRADMEDAWRAGAHGVAMIRGAWS
jgi:8-oxo-dGTP diphosphatase